MGLPAGNFHKGLGRRIDYLLPTPGLAGDLQRCGIARDYRKGKKPWDHAPLLAQLGPEADGITILGARCQSRTAWLGGSPGSACAADCISVPPT